MAGKWIANRIRLGVGDWLSIVSNTDDPNMVWVDRVEGEEEAKAAGQERIKSPTEKPPADPAWMVEVAREGCAQDAATLEHHGINPDNYRSGAYDDTGAFRSSINALRLALERGHVVEPLRWTEEALVEAAREDAAQANEGRGNLSVARQIRRGEMDGGMSVTVALQARRNMLREMDPDFREAAEPVKIDLSGVRAVLADPGPDEPFASYRPAGGSHASVFDLEAALKRAFASGWSEAKCLLMEMQGGGTPATYADSERECIARILSTLPAKE